MKRNILLLLFLTVQTVVFAQEYFPEGTKWTEIRLDTLKYDNWYSQVGDEWVPNFETIEYFVRGDYPDRDWIYKKVYTNGPEWTDSLTLLIREAEYNGHNSVLVSIMTHNYEGGSYVPWPGEAYQFDWNVGKGLYYEDITMSNTTSLVSPRFYYGIIDEIKEGYFGGSQSLKYVDLDGKAPDDKSNSPKRNVNTNGGRIIQGIGITEWNDGECLFGPPNLYSAMSFDNPERHYRSMLVHFERNGEVLYDVWPEKRTSDFAQDDYRPLVKQGKKWTYHHDTYQYVYDYHYTLEGDTVVAGKDCLKMYSENRYGDGERQYEGALFEENKKVYCFFPYKEESSIEEPALLYDFGCEVGDVFHMNAIELVTQAISAVEVNGKSVNRYDFQAQQPDKDDEPFVIGNLSWIEGVGATMDFFGMLPLQGNYNSLVACEVNGEVIYQSATSIQGIKSNTLNSDGAIFDLQGRRLSATPAKGIYIQNGKKRIVR